MDTLSYQLLGPVHTNVFSNENGAALLRLQKDLRFENAFIPSVRMVAPVRDFGYSRSSGLAPGRFYFDDVTIFR